jgi:hypothetical protein
MMREKGTERWGTYEPFHIMLIMQGAVTWTGSAKRTATLRKLPRGCGSV